MGREVFKKENTRLGARPVLAESGFTQPCQYCLRASGSPMGGAWGRDAKREMDVVFIFVLRTWHQVTSTTLRMVRPGRDSRAFVA